MKKYIVSLAVGAVISAFGADQNSSEKLKSAAGDLKKMLMGELKSKITEGPAVAVDFCSKNALEITKKVADKNSVNIKRVTDKNRNPKNTMDEGDKKVFAKFAEAVKQTGKPGDAVIVVENGVQKYYEPLVIGEMCVVCHGNKETMAKATNEAIDTAYPKDLAKGYKAGDLRGMIVVW